MAQVRDKTKSRKSVTNRWLIVVLLNEVWECMSNNACRNPDRRQRTGLMTEPISDIRVKLRGGCDNRAVGCSLDKIAIYVGMLGRVENL